MAFRAEVVLLAVALAAAAMSAAAQSNSVQFGMKFDVASHGLPLDLDGDELMMESESARRQLVGTGAGGYISYGALRSNSVPCNNRGQSYYNCRDHQQANPYQRSCTRATRCARNNR
ncbi:protein RALF-like 33 [Andrographis paniculata]|uniref:protein RALF-like 33 n=1 Tax=Andrographis paniculata TaxID=175694 RepID=UPI0021E8C0DC|nr:protein RALF-like 33 [Andrographis paniculata]